MPIEIIRKRKTIEEIRYELYFRDPEDSTRGWWFPCSEDGVVDSASLSDIAKESFQMCQAKGLDQEVQRIVNRYTEPTVGRCYCGREVYLYGFTNTCECGRDYNWAGQLLADRSQWGEETGESLADILSIP